MGASAAVNLSYIGAGPTAGQQIIADVNSGPRGKTLYGYGTIVSGSDATTVRVNYIDGVQTLGSAFTIGLTRVAVNATTSTYADYYSNGPVSRMRVGDTVGVVGFTNSGNNVTNLAVSQVFTDHFSASNSGVVAETNNAATVTDATAATPTWVNLFYAGNPADSSTAAALFAKAGTAGYFGISNVNSTGFTVNYPTVTTSGVTISFGAVLAFSS